MQTPFPLHFPLTDEMVQATPGLLALDFPQTIVCPLNWHLRVLKQSFVAAPHLALTAFNWQLTLQQDVPPKCPTPGSHCSVGSTIPFPHVCT